MEQALAVSKPVSSAPAVVAGKKKGYAGYIIGGLVLAGAVIGVFVIKGKDDLTLWKRLIGGGADKKKIDDVEEPTDTPPAGTSKWVDESFPLKKGMFGGQIKNLQTALGIGADGKFGSGTESKVKAKFGSATVTQAQYDSLVNPKPTAFDLAWNKAKSDGGDGNGRFVYNGRLYSITTGKDTGVAPKPKETVSGGANYEAVAKALKFEVTSPEKHQVADVTGENEKYRFHFFPDGAWSLTTRSGSSALKGGTYTAGGQKMVVTGGGSGTYSNYNVIANAKAIVKKYYGADGDDSNSFSGDPNPEFS